MATETSKTKALWNEDVTQLMTGDGIDIGCGVDPVFDWVDRFDQEQGDANQITQYVTKKYDFVFSSHALEHMNDPVTALSEWYSILKPGGHLIIVVPDEDLYEQGFFPSVFNGDHKATFTIDKPKSWSPRSHNVVDLVKGLGAELLDVKRQDYRFEHSWLRARPLPWSKRLYRIYQKLVRRPFFQGRQVELARWFVKMGAVIDQTALPDGRLAQIQFICRKPITRSV